MRVRVWILALSVASASALGMGSCANGLLEEPDASDGSIGSGDSGGDGTSHTDGGFGPDGACLTPNMTCYFDGGKVCTDTQTDPNHCGSCTHSCFAPVEGCDGGVCVSACGSQTECIPDSGPIPDGGD